jgi:hypothetical protein
VGLEAPRGMAVGVGQAANLVDFGYAKNNAQEAQVLLERSARPYDTGRRIITAMPPFAEWERSFPDDARRQRLSAAQVNVKRAVARGEWAVGEGGPPGRPRARLAYARDASSHSGGSARHRTGWPPSRPGAGRTPPWSSATSASSEPWRERGQAESKWSIVQVNCKNSLFRSTADVR